MHSDGTSFSNGESPPCFRIWYHQAMQMLQLHYKQRSEHMMRSKRRLGYEELCFKHPTLQLVFCDPPWRNHHLFPGYEQSSTEELDYSIPYSWRMESETSWWFQPKWKKNVSQNEDVPQDMGETQHLKRNHPSQGKKPHEFPTHKILSVWIHHEFINTRFHGSKKIIESWLPAKKNIKKKP